MKGKINRKWTAVGNFQGYQRTIKENLPNTQNLGIEQLSDKITTASERFCAKTKKHPGKINDDTKEMTKLIRELKSEQNAGSIKATK